MTLSSSFSDATEFECVSEAELLLSHHDVPIKSALAPTEQSTLALDDASQSDASSPALGTRRGSAHSGVRPSPTAISSRIDAAQTACAQTEHALSELFRTAKLLSASVSGLRKTNAALRVELETLAQMSKEEVAFRVTLEQRVEHLEIALNRAECDAAQDKELVYAEHDAFISKLVDDYEREIAGLRAELAHARFEPKLAASR